MCALCIFVRSVTRRIQERERNVKTGRKFVPALAANKNTVGVISREGSSPLGQVAGDK